MIAFDTNVLVYALQDDLSDSRCSAALALIARTSMIGAIIPYPVIGELFNVCRKKQIADVARLKLRVELWMTAFCGSPATFDDYLSAAGLSQDYELQYFDALIATVAQRAGAAILLSEDMQDGFEVGGMKIVNPFAVANETLLADYFGSVL